MKRLFITSVIALSSAILFSCNNGPFDTDPANDNSAVQNPSNPSSSTNVYLGSMEATVNGVQLLFSPVFHYTDTFNIRRMVAYVKNDSLYRRTFTITFPENSYLGPAEYEIGADTLNLSFEYTEFDTKDSMYKTYIASTANGNSNKIMLKVTGDEGGHMRGELTGAIFRTLPTFSNTDSISFRMSQYYSEKRAFPLK